MFEQIKKQYYRFCNSKFMMFVENLFMVTTWPCCIISLLGGLVLVGWPLPAFIFDDGNAYFDWLFQNETDDPSRFAALPFVWAFLSLPVGLLMLLASLIMGAVIYGQRDS